jgi:hypothetical protein
MTKALVCDNARDELLGKRAQVRDDLTDVDYVLAQFDEVGLEVDGVRLDQGWHRFHRDAFSPVMACSTCKYGWGELACPAVVDAEEPCPHWEEL